MATLRRLSALYAITKITAIAIACAKKDCAEMEMDVMPKLVGDNEEIEAPMRFRSAIAKILKIHNSPNTIKPQDIEEMEKNGVG